jgi:hypothetical protein
MNKLLRHEQEQEQEQALLHNIIEVEVINFIFKFSILTLLDDQERTSQHTFINL